MLVREVTCHGRPWPVRACLYPSVYPCYPGLSPEQAADNPELAKKIAAEQETLDGLRARMDAFPKKKGTMYCARLHTSTVRTCTCDASCVCHAPDITKEKAEISENLLAAMMKNAMTAEERAEVEQAEAAKKAAADAEKQAAADAKNAEAVAAKAAKAAEAEQKKAKAAEVAAEKKVAAEAKKVAAVEAAAAKKAKAAEEKQRKADEVASKKAAKAAKPVR